MFGGCALRKDAQGRSYVFFNLGVDNSYVSSGTRKRKGSFLYIPVMCYDHLAVKVSRFKVKLASLLIEGKLFWNRRRRRPRGENGDGDMESFYWIMAHRVISLGRTRGLSKLDLRGEPAAPRMAPAPGDAADSPFEPDLDDLSVGDVEADDE